MCCMLQYTYVNPMYTKNDFILILTLMIKRDLMNALKRTVLTSRQNEDLNAHLSEHKQ